MKHLFCYLNDFLSKNICNDLLNYRYVVTHKNITQLILSYETFVYAMDFILKSFLI